ncbi:MAG: hypothetical protein OQK68_06745, partial [Sedimenticola sp.]|nr:hypothetical protein [Sedimenticola sp.]
MEFLNCCAIAESYPDEEGGTIKVFGYTTIELKLLYTPTNNPTTSVFFLFFQSIRGSTTTTSLVVFRLFSSDITPLLLPLIKYRLLPTLQEWLVFLNNLYSTGIEIMASQQRKAISVLSMNT